MPQLEPQIIVSLAMATISLVISLIVAARNWRYSETTVRYTSRNHYMNALFDINRQMVTRPELWAIYDDHPMAAVRGDDPESSARREAFVYFHFNLFETVFNDYKKVLRQTKDDQRYWESWEAWLRRFFRSSSEARALFKKSISQEVFHRDFVEYVNQIIDEAAETPEAARIKAI